MKYMITHSCGHTEEVAIFGKNDYRQWRIRTLESEVCSECSKKQAQERMQSLEEEYGLPELEGSEKQIDWARRIRAAKFAEADDDYEVIEYMSKITRAKWWIDNRDESLYWLKGEIEKEAGRMEAREIQKKIDVDFTVFPENMKEGAVTVKIIITPDEVRAEFQKDAGAIDVMHDCHFNFYVPEAYWYHTIGTTSGTAEDRAAELMNKLLTAGYPVICDNDEVKRKAVEADYEEEHTRWILAGPTIKAGTKKDGKYLKITIGYKDGTYEKWSDVGARYDRPNMIIRIEKWQAVMDMAEKLGYKFTPNAEKMIQDYQEASSHTTKVKTKLKDNEKVQKTISDEEKLLAELMDD